MKEQTPDNWNSIKSLRLEEFFSNDELSNLKDLIESNSKEKVILAKQIIVKRMGIQLLINRVRERENGSKLALFVYHGRLS